MVLAYPASDECRLRRQAALLTALVSVVVLQFSMSVVFVAVTASLLAIATAMAINSMPWAYAEVLAPMMPMKMAFVTMPTIVWVHWTLVAFVMALVKFTPADVLTFPQAIVIATATHWTPWNVWRWCCAADVDADGICDDVDPCVGQLDECGVCNGDGSSCADPCAAAGQSSAYTMTVEASPAAGAGGTVYRFYVNAQ